MFKYFHICNHERPVGDLKGESRTLEITNGGNTIDLLISGAAVSDIVEVRAIKYQPHVEPDVFLYDNKTEEQTYEDKDADDGYYDDRNEFFVDFSKYFLPGKTISEPLPARFYQTFLHNRIKWEVKPPQQYQVTMNVLFTSQKKVAYPFDDCPICQSKGWFVDILDSSGTFSVDSGIEKVIQRLIKDLLTEVYSNVLKLEYGTLLKQRINGNSDEDERLFDSIRLIISEVEDRYLVRQSEEGTALPDDETLVSLRVENISRSYRTPASIRVEVIVQTLDERSNFRFLI